MRAHLISCMLIISLVHEIMACIRTCVRHGSLLGIRPSKSSLYYEGFVDNLDETLEPHRRCTYGTRTSNLRSQQLGTISQSEHGKENNTCMYSNVANKQVKLNNIKLYNNKHIIILGLIVKV